MDVSYAERYIRYDLNKNEMIAQCRTSNSVQYMYIPEGCYQTDDFVIIPDGCITDDQLLIAEYVFEDSTYWTGKNEQRKQIPDFNNISSDEEYQMMMMWDVERMKDIQHKMMELPNTSTTEDNKNEITKN